MPHKTETYQHTIGGLLQKREEMTQELATIRERLAIISNDIQSLDRVLETLGYQGEIKLTPRTPRIVLFYKNELRQYLAGQLREHGPMTTRQMAENLIKVEGKDVRDRRMTVDVVRRMGRCLRNMQQIKMATRSPQKIKGEYVWRLAG